VEPTLIDTEFNWPYTAQDLAAAINRRQNDYGMITNMGLFGDADPLATGYARISYADGRFFVLAAEVPDGTPNVLGDDDEKVYIVKMPHFPVQDRVTVADVQDRVMPGGSNVLETLEGVVDRKLTKIYRSHEITWEYLRVGALFGKIRDGKGRVLLDLHATFEVPQKTIYFDFTNPNLAVQDLCWEVSRHMEDNAQGESWTDVEVPVSREFMSKLVQHPNVRDVFSGWAASEARNGGDARRAFPFGGLVFKEYNGVAPLLDGTSARFIPANEGVAVPIGTTETFAEFDGPAHHIARANRPPDTKVFVTQEVMKHGRGVEIVTQSNTLPVLTRPELAVRVVGAAE
jgi:hypothetical protein